MVEGNWRFSPPLGVGLICATLMLLAALSHQQDNCERYQAAQHAGYTQQCILGVPFNGPNQGPPREQGTARDEWREERDLQAQIDMARWTLALLVVSTVGTIIAGFGVIYVGRTLRLQLVANEDARKRFVAEQRPWLDLKVSVRTVILNHDEKPDDTFFASEGTVNIYVNATARIVGNLPALHVYFDIPPTAKSTFSAPDLEEFSRRIEDHKREAPMSAGATMFPGDTEGLKNAGKVVARIPPGSPVVVAFVPVFVSYRFAGSDDVHVTSVVQYLVIDTRDPPGDRVIVDYPHHLNLPPT